MSTTASPLQPFYLPNAPTVKPATFAGARSSAPTGLTPQQLQALSPQTTIAQIQAGALPEFANAQRSLNDQLAAMGIVGGGALDATAALQKQLLSSLAPTLANAIQTSQGNTLQAQEFGLQGGLQQALANAGFLQQAGTENTQAANTTNLANLQSLINQQTYNTNAANTGNQNLWNALQSAWAGPFNAFNSINLAGLNSAGSIAGIGAGNAGNLSNIIASTFPVQQPPNFAGLGAALGGFGTPAANQSVASNDPYGAFFSGTPAYGEAGINQ